MDKKQLRESIMTKLKSFTEAEKHCIERDMQEYLFNSTFWKQSKTLGITISKGIEWDTSNIIKKAWEQGKQVTVPKCLPKEKELRFHLIDNFSQLEVVYYNLLEPKPETKVVDKNEIDLIIVPGVVFNADGFRIGFGGGYYDRFLADFQNTTVALLHSSQLSNDLPVENHDIAVQNMLTEDGFI